MRLLLVMGNLTVGHLLGFAEAERRTDCGPTHRQEERSHVGSRPPARSVSIPDARFRKD